MFLHLLGGLPRISAAVILITGVLLPALAAAEVRVKVQTSYYAISGKDGKALNASMLSGGANRISLSHAVAATETEMDFSNPKLAIRNGRCVVEDVDVILKIRYVYPKWKNRRNASAEMRARWAAFWQELKRHEEQHGEIARAGAAALERELRKLSGSVATGCSDFGHFAALRLNAVVDKTARAQRMFDRREYASFSRISRLQRVLYETR